MKITRKAGKIEALRQATKSLDSQEGKVGWFESAKYEDGTPVAAVAYVQEHGSAKRSIPMRPFFRPTVTEKQTSWRKVAEDVSRAAVQGKIAPDQMTEALCLAAEGDVRTTITKLTSPALSYITLLARMHRKAGNVVTGKTIGELSRKIDQGPQQISGVSTKPLVDTGYMLATLTSVVTKK